MKKWLSLALVLTSTLCTAPTWAHHSIQGIVDDSKLMEFEGRLVDIDWVNPHIWFTLEVINDQGETESWRLESVPTAMANRVELTRDSFMDYADQPVKFWIFPPRDANARHGFMVRIQFADGHFIHMAPPVRS